VMFIKMVLIITYALEQRQIYITVQASPIQVTG